VACDEAASAGGTLTVKVPELLPRGGRAQNVGDDVAFKIVKKGSRSGPGNTNRKSENKGGRGEMKNWLPTLDAFRTHATEGQPPSRFVSC
jgi:hypothetical protein